MLLLSLIMTTTTWADTAIFAGGCFWCVEEAFDKVPGVIRTTSGYTGGHVNNPTYPQVSSGVTGHVEAVSVEFDPRRISYPQLLMAFWRNIDPFDANGQFVDRGKQYRAVIFYRNAKQRQQALASKKAVQKRLGRRVVTEILPAKTFYRAEEYHQDYAKKKPWRYKFYTRGNGRKQRLQQVWGN